MATKPSSILGYNPLRTNCVSIPGGKMAEGFLPGEKPPAQYLGDIFERIDRWLEYVKDGAWTGNTTITGTLGVTGNTTITGTHAVSGNATVGGTLGVSDTLTMAINKDIILSGTGHVVDSFERTVRVAAAAFVPDTGSGGSAPLLTLDGVGLGSGVRAVYYAISLPVGSTITEFGFSVTDNVTGTCVVAGRLSRVFLSGSSWNSGTLDTTANSASTGNAQTLTVTGLSRVLSASEFYVLHPLVQSGAGTAKLNGAYVKWKP